MRTTATTGSGGSPVVARTIRASAYSPMPATTSRVRLPRQSETAPTAGGPSRRPALPSSVNVEARVTDSP
jgi:hypothetical protein